MEPAQWALWRLECGQRAVGAAGAVPRESWLACLACHCWRGQARVVEVTAEVRPIPRAERADWNPQAGC